MINNALSVLPTRPIRFIVPLIIVGVLSFYYWEQHRKCTDINQFRVSLTEALQAKAPSDKFRLVDFTDFAWDKVRVATNIKSGERNAECPFGWNWASGERESLMDSGLLTVLMFGHGESIVGYAELRSDKVEFRGVESSLTPKSAVFSIGKNFTNKAVSLTLSQ